MFYLNILTNFLNGKMQVRPAHLSPFIVKKDRQSVCDLVGLKTCHTRDGQVARVRTVKVPKGMCVTVSWGENSSVSYSFKPLANVA